MKTRIVVLVLVIAALGGLYWFSVHSGQAGMSDEQLKALGLVELPEPKATTGLEFVNQYGEPFEFSETHGKWTYAFFGFTNCPDICPITMSLLKRAEDQIYETAKPDSAAKFQGMFVSVDPERDDVDAVKNFVAHFSPRFVGLTGSEAAIAKLAEKSAVGFSRIASTTSELEYLIEHQGHIVVFSPEGSIHGFIKPPHDPTQLTRIFLHLDAAKTRSERQSS